MDKWDRWADQMIFGWVSSAPRAWCASNLEWFFDSFEFHMCLETGSIPPPKKKDTPDG